MVQFSQKMVHVLRENQKLTNIHFQYNTSHKMKTVISTLALLITFGLGFAVRTFVPAKSPDDSSLKRVTGIGGIFFKCKDPNKVKEWYKVHLGLNTDRYGTNFEWRQASDPIKKGFTQWSAFSEKTKYFEPSTRDFMINYRVDNLVALVSELKKEGVTIVDTIETYDYGKFVHILDIEANKIELWEPNDIEYDKLGDKIGGGRTK